MNTKSVLIITVASLASLLEVIDTSIVNVAIPAMMGNLGVSLDDISAVVTGYAIANAVVLPLSAWTASKIGKRKYYLGCIAAFTASSFACGISPNLQTLVICRIVQGLAGGALLPTSQELIFNQFPADKAGYAGAVFGLSIIIGPTLGPVLGGYLSDNFGWRSVFNVNIPLGVLALLIGFAVINDDENHSEKGTYNETFRNYIDFRGLALLCAGIGCLQYVLERGEANDWFSSRMIIVCSIISAVSMAVFVWWELKVENPVVDIKLFRKSTVSIGVTLIAGMGFFIYSSVFITPYFINIVFHYNATQTGMLFIPGAILTMLLLPIVGALTDKIDPRYLIATGFCGVCTCLLLMNRFSTTTNEWGMLCALFARAFAMAFLFLPITSSVSSQFEGYDLAQVSGLLNLLRQIGGSFSIALVSTVLSRNMHQNMLNLTSKVTMLNQQTQAAFAQAKGAAALRMSTDLGCTNADSVSLMTIAARIKTQAFVMTFDQLMIVILCVEIICFIPVIWLKIDRKKPIKFTGH